MSNNNEEFFRIDTGYTTSTWYLDDNGFLTVEATIARIGVQEYKNEDGSIRREFRPPEEVSNIESLKTFRMLPHCLEHPPVLLNDTNAKYFTVGFTGENPRYENGYVKTTIKIIDKDAKDQALNGERREVSCGYTCQLEWTSGEYKGEKYDCIQRKIKGNHTCQTIKGRAGKDVKIHIDSNFGESLNESVNDIFIKENEVLRERIKHLKNKELILRGDGNGYRIRNDGKLDDLVINLENKVKKDNLNMKNVFSEIQGMSDSQKANYLMAAYGELAQENQSLQSARVDAEKAAALHEGRADRWRSELESIKNGGNFDSEYSDRNDASESLKRQVKEKQIRCDHLEGEIANLQNQLRESQKELREVKGRNDSLMTELNELNQSKRREIVSARQDWLKAYQRVSPFLPENAKTELQSDPTIADNRIALYRLAIQNVKPHVDLSNKTDSYIEGQFESIEDDYKNKGKGDRLSNDSLRFAVDSAKNLVTVGSPNSSSSDLNQLRTHSMVESSEAWKITN